MIAVVTGDFTKYLTVTAQYYGIDVVEAPTLAPGGLAQMTWPCHDEPLGLNRLVKLFPNRTAFAIGNILASEQGCGRLLVLGGRHVGRSQAMREFARAVDAKIISHPLPKPEDWKW